MAIAVAEATVAATSEAEVVGVAVALEGTSVDIILAARSLDRICTRPHPR